MFDTLRRQLNDHERRLRKQEAKAFLLPPAIGGWSTFTGTLADDASLTLTNLHGFFYIREHTGNQLGFVRAGYAGTPVVISSGFTINTADTDGNWCFFHNGSHYVLKNRTGGSRSYTVHVLSMS